MLFLGIFFFPFFFIFLGPLFFFLLMGAMFGRRRGGYGYCGPGGEFGSSASHTLEARYARGEIDQNEYLARKKDLSPETV